MPEPNAVSPAFGSRLDHHLWTERKGNAFFDRFFIHSPPAGFLLTPFPYSDDPDIDPYTESVIEWVLNAQAGWSQAESGPGHACPHPRPAEQQRPWRCCASQPLGFPRTMYPSYQTYYLQCDLFTYGTRTAAAAIPDRFQWDQVVSIGHIKRQIWDDHDHAIAGDKVGQFQRCPRAVFGAQPGRMYLHTFSISMNKMRCFLFTRCGMHASRWLDLTKPDDLLICVRVLYGHATLAEQDMGMSVLQPGFLVKFPAQFPVPSLSTAFLLSPIIPPTDLPTLLCRSTTFWHAKRSTCSPSSRDGEVLIKVTECDFLLKLSHPQTRLVVLERNLYQHCEITGVKGVSKCHAYKELGPSVHNLLGEECKTVAGAELLQSESVRARQSWRESHWDRIGVLLVLDLGIPLCEFHASDGSYTNLFACFRDAIRAHYSLLVSGRVLHRDISYDNIMITRLGTRDDRFRGFLINLDQAFRTDQIAGAGAGAVSGGRAGTIEFMSTNLLKPDTHDPIQHSYYDDLQSFLWVFIWTCTHPHERHSLGWSNETALGDDEGFKYSWCMKTLLMIMNNDRMREMSAGFENMVGSDDNVKACCEIVRDIVSVVLPADPEPVEPSLTDIRERLYKGMVAVFDRQLPASEQIGPDWMDELET